MLRFFRKIRQQFFREQDFGKSVSPVNRYLFYAIGEIILVMIGILLALQVNTWNQKRIDASKEKMVLLELKNDLEANLGIFESSARWETNRVEGIKKIMQAMDAGQAWTDSFSLELKWQRHFEEFFIMSATYNSLNSNGFDLISSDELRRGIIKLYDIIYKREGNRVDVIGKDLITTRENIFIKHTSWDLLKGVIVPNEPEKIAKNHELYNMLSLRLQTKGYAINFNNECSRATEELLELLNLYLEDF